MNDAGGVITTATRGGGASGVTAARAVGASHGNADARVEELYAVYQEHASSSYRSSEPAALTALRLQAAERFRLEGFPTSRLEAWRFTNPAPAVRARSRRASPRSLDELTVQERRSIDTLLLEGCRNVVVLDGYPVAGLDVASHAGEAGGATGAAAREVRVRAFSEIFRAARGTASMVEGLGRLADPRGHANAFSLLNTALFDDGVVVEAAERAQAPQPIHLLHVVTANGGPDGEDPMPATFPRVLVRAGAGSQLTVIETYASLGAGRALVHPVTELFSGPGAALRHYRVTREGAGVLHLGSQHLRLERDASASSLLLSWGGELVRCDVHALLAGEGGDCVLDGLYVLGGRQHFDTHMRVEHLAPHCDSHELYKGVLDDRAHAVFDGRIYVHRGAQKTDAKQTNRNLLLSDRAVANSNPTLEIFADDVKCTHGSTVGQLEPDALFYLRSRGIDREAARGLLTYAFASELLGRISVAPLRATAEAVLAERLTGGPATDDLRPQGDGEDSGAWKGASA